ncbi:hypothetical protein FA15DRAFT_704950 [Coprinopsis marcescibilis]|uniref:Methyltransferase n=1 Tax=Coprinopsis marcescibilis TaxID=230819 RepID=A0A5C3KUK0_COPMA|nr:hypothetical protein FA15DRAFT_704950 [Coprinopsis marcescibilis]
MSPIVEASSHSYPHTAELIKRLTGANRVDFIAVYLGSTNQKNTGSEQQVSQPASLTHVDQTAKAAVARVERHLPADEVSGLLQKRLQIINVWRPISHSAWDWPLALCDYRSIDEATDTVPVAPAYSPDREGEMYGISYNASQRWKYIQGMTPDEAVIFKCFDSIDDGGVARFAPHTGFEDPTTPKGSLPRESVEIRALVFYD